MKNSIYLFLVASFIILSNDSFGQYNFTGQLVQRAEFRHGYGKLMNTNSDPAAFISQRTRIQFNYQLSNIQFYTSIQDIRTWGNTSQIKLSDGLLSIYEAYAEIKCDSHLKVKIGRQELNYDNARFLGNLDWALQGRSHDFALIKYEYNKIKIHAGGGYNQDNEQLNGNIFNTTNQYKTAQFFRAENQFKNITIAFLFWNNGKQYVTKDTSGKITKNGIYYTQTIGLPTIKYQYKNFITHGFLYIQKGKNENGKNVNAYNGSLNFTYQYKKSIKKNLQITVGHEIISGKEFKQNGTSSITAYSPMYGTNHAHNGYMDLFFVGGRFENSVGLNDTYIRLKHDLSKSNIISINIHNFGSAANIYDSTTLLKSKLGNELDLSWVYIHNKIVSLQSGFSYYIPTTTFKFLQNNLNLKNNQYWAYVMLIIRPDSDKKFIGLIF